MTYSEGGKRVLDIAVSVLVLVVLAPVIVAVALVVLFAQGRPVLFTQQRIGLNAKPFRLYKFRTMQPVADDKKDSFEIAAADRTTRVGRLLRGVKLDELPQLWNVIKGDMSLVGPRPEVADWVDSRSGTWKKVLSVRPGLTDYASIHYIDEEDLLRASPDPEEQYRHVVLPAKLQMAEKYVGEMSLWVDLAIMLSTARRVIWR